MSRVPPCPFLPSHIDARHRLVLTVFSRDKKDDKPPSDDECGGSGNGSSSTSDSIYDDDAPSKKDYQKIEYETKQDYVEAEGTVFGKLDELVDDDKTFRPSF
ncbi:hypothetical protein L1987_43341 [Smallanthus sonchifolius]|uniref:Uncharacterized protein n=1 Tax=Smallanthus sonchifolius TaxID=185202 RepID=A0ACB9GMC9_9ASTR|nr:hypothetical protein L1987_43341 [Smallanthus sonchifolius]